jgi:hypothetical protein
MPGNDRQLTLGVAGAVGLLGERCAEQDHLPPHVVFWADSLSVPHALPRAMTTSPLAVTPRLQA